MQPTSGNIETIEKIFSNDEEYLAWLKKQGNERLIKELQEHGKWIPISDKHSKKLKRMSKPRRKNWMRNRPCVCGSRKKFKKCCWHKYN